MIKEENDIKKIHYPQQEEIKASKTIQPYQIDVSDGQEEYKHEELPDTSISNEMGVDISFKKELAASASIIISDVSSTLSKVDPLILKIKPVSFFNPDVIHSLIISSFNLNKNGVFVDNVFGLIIINVNQPTFSIDDIIKILRINYIYASSFTRYMKEQSQDGIAETSANEREKSSRISDFFDGISNFTKTVLPPWYIMLPLFLSLISLISLVSSISELKWLAIVSCAFSLPLILLRSFVSLKYHVIDSNCLAIITITGFIALTDFVSAGFVSSLLVFSSWLGSFLNARIEYKFQRIFQSLPEYVNKIVNTNNNNVIETKIHIDELQIGDQCKVKPNRRIPVDGIIETDGTTIVDESMLFGPSYSNMHKGLGDKAFAGSVNIGNQDIIVKAISTIKETIAWKVGSMLIQRCRYQSHWVSLLKTIENIGKYLLILTAIIIGTVPFYLGIEEGIKYIKIGFILLGLASSCCCSTTAGIFSYPFQATYMNGLVVAFENGIYIKNEKVIDSICQINTIVVNKTGTLTEGQLNITNLRMISTNKSAIRQPQEGEIHSKFLIPNLTNQLEGNQIIKTLSEIEGVESVSIQVRSKKLSVIFSEVKCNVELIMQHIRAIGFDVSEEMKKNLSKNDIVKIIKTCEEGDKKNIIISIQNEEDENGADFSVVERTEIQGEGIRCVLNDRRVVFIGNNAIFKYIPELKKIIDGISVAQFTLSKSIDEELSLSESLIWAKQNEISNSSSIGWIIIDGNAVSVFSMNEKIKNETCYITNKLHNMGMSISLLTGTTKGSCDLFLKALIHEVNPNMKSKSILTSISFNLSTKDKKELINQMKKCNEKNPWKKNPYILAIDNDDGLFDCCDVSIGINGKDYPQLLNTSSIIIPHTNLCSIEWIFDLCKDIQLSSLVGAIFSMILKAILVSLTIAGKLTIGVAFLLDFVFYLLAWWNSSKIFNTKAPRISPPDENEIRQLRGWRRAVEGSSLGNTNASVFVPTSNGSCGRNVLSYLGVGLIVSVGYMDPGNWATSVAGGAAFGYALMFVVLLSSLTAMFLQYLSLKIGIATERDLAMAIHDSFHPYITFILWIIAECAIAATDLAELLGVAIALNLLFKLPTPIGVVLTALDVFLVLLLQRDRIRILELIVGVLTLTIVFCLVYLIYLSKPEWKDVFTGLVPTKELFTNQDQLFLAIGIIGATVMPHNLFLHSGLVQTRGYQRTDIGKQRAVRYATMDSTMSLLIAFLVNSMILILSGATFNKDHKDVNDITAAYNLFTPILGPSFASIFFGVALFASGQQSSLTGTYAGQIVMEGMADIHLQPWKRRMLTRIVAMVPAVIITSIYEDGAGDLLIMSQVILSLALPFVIIPLIWITSDEQKMGKDFVNSRITMIIGWITTLILIALNMYMISSPSTWQIGSE